MKIAIPSYKRPQTLQRKTLKLLRREGFDAKDITVFVASEEERAEYQKYLIPEYSPALVVGEPGIHRQRRFMHSYYPSGTLLLCIDDDISSIKRPYQKQDPLPALLERCFQIADSKGCNLWGIQPTSDGRCLKDQMVVGLRYIPGGLYGLKTGLDVTYPYPCVEDFMRTIEHYKADGKVMRFDGMGLVTQSFKEPGGLQAPDVNRAGVQLEQMKWLAETYPEYVVMRKKHLLDDVRFRVRTELRVAAPFSAENV